MTQLAVISPPATIKCGRAGQEVAEDKDISQHEEERTVKIEDIMAADQNDDVMAQEEHEDVRYQRQRAHVQALRAAGLKRND